MKIAIWIIAICEVIRMAQNAIQLSHAKRSEKRSVNAYNEFIKNLKQSDREFVRNMLEEFEKEQAAEEEDEQIQDTE